MKKVGMLFLGICSFLAISCTSDKDGKDFVKCVLKQGILERAAMNINCLLYTSDAADE